MHISQTFSKFTSCTSLKQISNTIIKSINKKTKQKYNPMISQPLKAIFVFVLPMPRKMELGSLNAPVRLNLSTARTAK